MSPRRIRQRKKVPRWGRARPAGGDRRVLVVERNAGRTRRANLPQPGQCLAHRPRKPTRQLGGPLGQRTQQLINHPCEGPRQRLRAITGVGLRAVACTERRNTFGVRPGYSDEPRQLTSWAGS